MPVIPLLRITPEGVRVSQETRAPTTAGRGAGERRCEWAWPVSSDTGVAVGRSDERLRDFGDKQRGFERGCDAGGEKIEAGAVRFGIRVKNGDCERGGVLSGRIAAYRAGEGMGGEHGAELDGVVRFLRGSARLRRGLGNRFRDFLTRMLSRVCLFQTS